MDCNSRDSKKAVEILKIAKGQIEGIIKMIGEERYCVDVSKQLLAVIALIKKSNMIVLKRHLQTCVKDAMNEGSDDDKIGEIILLLEKYMDK